MRIKKHTNQKQLERIEKNVSRRGYGGKPTKDLTGKTFGRLTVISLNGFLPVGKIKKAYLPYWDCICSCGNKKIIKAQNLLKSKVPTKSCGCLQIERAKTQARSNKLPEGEAAFNTVYQMYKTGAFKRNYTFNLTKEQALTLFKGNCVYCGVESNQNINAGNHRSENGNFIYTGIDRMDNNIGYEIGNCVSCCGQCNRLKYTNTVEEFKAYIKRTYLHLYGKGLL